MTRRERQRLRRRCGRRRRRPIHDAEQPQRQPGSPQDALVVDRDGGWQLGVTDALVGQVRGDDKARLHDTIALNELRFSSDLVALDVISMADVAGARKAYPIEGEKPMRTELFFNAELLELGIANTNRIEVLRVP